MIVDDYIKGLAVAAAWKIARRSGVNAMLGVLFAFRNSADRLYHGNWLQALEDFSDLDLFDDLPDVRNPDFLQVLQRVDGIFDGSIPDTLTNGATGIHEVSTRHQPICAKIGDLIFTR